MMTRPLLPLDRGPVVTLILYFCCYSLHLNDALTYGANSAGTLNSFWNYQDTEIWRDISEICETGRAQSPILLATHEALIEPRFFRDPLRLSEYVGSYDGVLANDGHAITWTINSSQADLPRLSGSMLDATFVFHQLIFHWGGDAAALGSEHAIDYQAGPMEVQFIHYNIRYGSYGVAQSQKDGLAALAFLFTLSDDSTNDGAYSEIANSLTRVSAPSSHFYIPLQFSELVPKETLADGVFFRYDGSMTMPPCLETVTWTVFRKRLKITHASFEAFRSQVKTSANELSSFGQGLDLLENNFRPMQRLHDRVVYTNSRQAKLPPGYSLPSASCALRQPHDLIVGMVFAMATWLRHFVL